MDRCECGVPSKEEYEAARNAFKTLLEHSELETHREYTEVTQRAALYLAAYFDLNGRVVANKPSWYDRWVKPVINGLGNRGSVLAGHTVE